MTIPSTKRRVEQPVLAPAARTRASSPVFNPRYTFQNFVVGPGNALAVGAARQVAHSRSDSYNPLFICGGVGLGKTHLLHAIGDAIAAGGGHEKVVYTTCEHFFNQLIEAVRKGDPDSFRDKYRSADVLLVDDIQFIAGKESTQEEFFHTFNALHESGKQVVLTSDSPPHALNPLTDRLRSRFEWGLIADIRAPDVQTRLAILQTKATERELRVPADVMQYLARGIVNIRELEGMLNRVVAFASLHRRRLTTALAASALGHMGPRHVQVNPDVIIRHVAGYFETDPYELGSTSRNKRTVLARQIAMYLLREETDASLDSIGESLGGRDHTTVRHGCERIERGLREDLAIRNLVDGVRGRLFSGSAPLSASRV